MHLFSEPVTRNAKRLSPPRTGNCLGRTRNGSGANSSPPTTPVVFRGTVRSLKVLSVPVLEGLIFLENTNLGSCFGCPRRTHNTFKEVQMVAYSVTAFEPSRNPKM